MRFKLGCDPEIFCLDSKNNYKSAIGTFGGTKDDPRPLDELGNGFAVQEDNVALEFNIPPSASSVDFINNITKIVDYLSNAAGAAFGLHFSKESGVLFPEDQLLDIRALEFGCDPDFNAWNGKVNPRPGAGDLRLRSAGGHVHVGLEEAITKREKCRIVQLMDLHLGIPSVLMDEGTMRKELYGKAGAMRFKSYGLEYRTLSNFWIFSDITRKWVWDATERALIDYKNGVDVSEKEELLVSTINYNNQRMASQLVAEYGLFTA